MKLTYNTGEPILPGDYALIDNRQVIVSSFISREVSERKGYSNFIGIRLIDDLNFTREILWLIPEERLISATLEEITISQKTKARISLLKRGEFRYLNSGVPVCVGDVVAIERTFGLMSLCQICSVIYEVISLGEIIAADGTSIQNPGCLITDKIFGTLNHSTVEFLDGEGFLSDDWAHVFFIRRGGLCRPPRPKDPISAALWDETFKEQ